MTFRQQNSSCLLTSIICFYGSEINTGTIGQQGKKCISYKKPLAKYEVFGLTTKIITYCLMLSFLILRKLYGA